MHRNNKVNDIRLKFFLSGLTMLLLALILPIELKALSFTLYAGAFSFAYGQMMLTFEDRGTIIYEQ